jgi:formylglycine-generating enzyme required for sulfatase activity
MGSPEDEAGRFDNETLHQVTLSRGFWLALTECTQGQWESVMGTDVAEMERTGVEGKTLGEVHATGAMVAMYFTSWVDARNWLAKMNQKHPLPAGWKWDLPTEAQWEYACRAGTETALPNGPLTIKGDHNGPELEAIAWYGGNSSVGYKDNGVDTSGWKDKRYPGGTAGAREVGLKQANAWGLHDMIGNVWEWCTDWYGDYPSGATSDPTGPTNGSDRVFRGGGWEFRAALCRSAVRVWGTPGERGDGCGFRPAAVPTGR